MKRFIDTDRWKKPWYRRLSPELKCYWSWLTDHCDCAGIIDVDVEVAAFQIGADTLPDPSVAFPGKVIQVNEKYFIVDFVRFQNGPELNPSNNAHRGILKRLQTIGYDGVPNESTSPSLGPSEVLARSTGKGKGIGKGIGKGNGKSENNQFVSSYPDAVEQIWKEYPQTGRARSTRKKVHTQWKAMPKDSLDQVLEAIRAWSKSHNWQKDGGQFVPALDRWLRDRGYEDLPHGYAAAQKRTLTERQLKGLDL